MRTITTTLYKLPELSPEARSRAFEKYKTRTRREPLPWADEIYESLKATVEACGFKIRSADLGHSWDRCGGLTVEADSYDSRAHRFSESSRPFSLGYVWGRVLKPHGYERPAAPDYGGRFPGACPFTGVCYDEGFLEDLWKSLLSGKPLRKALDGLADTYARLLDDEREHLESEEAFEEWAENEEFTEDGEIANP